MSSEISAAATPNRISQGRGLAPPAPCPASALGALGGHLFTGLRPPVPAHVSVLVHIGLDQVAHLHGVDLPALAVAYLGARERGTNDPDASPGITGTEPAGSPSQGTEQDNAQPRRGPPRTAAEGPSPSQRRVAGVPHIWP